MRSFFPGVMLITSVLMSGIAFAEPTEIDAKTRLISHFKIGSEKSQFGRLVFNGGLEISAKGRAIGAMSGFRFLGNRTTFLGVSDTGFWFKGALERDPQGRPSGIGTFFTAPMKDRNGRNLVRKGVSDAESLAFYEDKIFVSFEQNARIDGYSFDDPLNSKVITSLDLQIPEYEFRRNGGLEALATAPDSNAHLSGSVLAFAERSVNNNGDLFAAIVTGPNKGVFFVKRNPPYNITDADFLPNGDLILLERRFSIARGVGMRLRQIKGDNIKAGATIDGEILLDVGAGYQIDNMEGLDVTIDDQGQIFLTLISDDNHSFLQRNLLLEFKLLN